MVLRGYFRFQSLFYSIYGGISGICRLHRFRSEANICARWIVSFRQVVLHFDADSNSQIKMVAPSFTMLQSGLFTSLVGIVHTCGMNIKSLSFLTSCPIAVCMYLHRAFSASVWLTYGVGIRVISFKLYGTRTLGTSFLAWKIFRYNLWRQLVCY